VTKATKAVTDPIDPRTELLKAIIADMTRQLQAKSGRTAIRVRVPEEMLEKGYDPLSGQQMQTEAGQLVLLPTFVVR
jgi:hypothetical protein